MKQSALATTLIMREMKGGRFYTLTRECRSDGLEPWRKGKEKKISNKLHFDFVFAVTAATWKTKTNPSQHRRSHPSRPLSFHLSPPSSC